MRAVTIVDGALEWREHPDPVPGKGELLVAVRAAGLNNADLMQVAGFYPAPPGSPQDIPGMELAGEVVAVGDGVYRFAIGDRVMAVVGGGAQAELAVVHERTAIPVPDNIDWPEAGGFPKCSRRPTTRCSRSAGSRSASGCACTAPPGASASPACSSVAAGASVVATVRNEELRPSVAAFGANVVAPDEFVDHGPFDVVLELVGAPNLPERHRIAGHRRTHRRHRRRAAAPPPELNLLALMGKRARIHGSTLRARPLEQKAIGRAPRRGARAPPSRTRHGQGARGGHLSDGRGGGRLRAVAAGGKLGKIVLVN